MSTTPEERIRADHERLEQYTHQVHRHISAYADRNALGPQERQDLKDMVTPERMVMEDLTLPPDR